MREYKKRRYYSISKYNPNFRNEFGEYCKNEWTSYSDIGKKYDSVEFNKDKYEEIEKLYIQVFFKILDYYNSRGINVVSVFKTSKKADFIKNNDLNLYSFYVNIKNNDRISINDKETIIALIKLSLREYITELDLVIHTKSRTEITFGFDFYMYLKTNLKVEKLKLEILNTKLFWN